MKSVEAGTERHRRPPGYLVVVAFGRRREGECAMITGGRNPNEIA